MINLNKIYFDGQGYAKYLIESNEVSSQYEIDIANRFNFTPVDSISFKQYPSQTFCDITIGDYHIKGVSFNHLFTDIKKQTRTILYPSHNPTPNPGELY